MRLALAFAIGYVLGIAAALHYAERESVALDDAELPIADPYVLRFSNGTAVTYRSSSN